ncbi:MAG: glycosyltransferase [Candidatus Auribacterota bacterium]|jgi:glycosyltransferase involved in cell wall biosynthesis|nr:glycosyltransferase [Candidatus Auribacterota bacterium]
MIKILQVLYLAQFGGGEVNTKVLIEHIDKKKFDVSACFLHQEGPMADIYRKSGIKTTVIGMKHGMDIFGALRFRQFLKKEQFDIVHIQLPNVITLAVAILTSPHVICHMRWGNADKRKGLKKIFLKYFFKRADLMITVCDHIKNILISIYGIPPVQIQTVYNGIELAKYSQKCDKTQIAAEFGIKNSSCIIGFMGRLIPLKGCHKLLRAVQDVILSDKNCYLVIIGDGTERDALEKLAKDLRIDNNVIFTGARDDIPRLLKLFDIFVLPSEVEAFPRVVEEALASGIPVIATNVGGVSEILRDGVDGFLIKTDIENQLKEKISYLKNNESIRATMAKSAIERSKEFDINKNARQIEQIYIQITKTTP